VLHDADGNGKTPSSNSRDVDIPDAELATPDNERVDQLQYTTEEALANLSDIKSSETSDATSASTSQCLYCPECYLPLHPDPDPEKLYIFLHALRYTTSFGTLETDMPDWA
jgi:tRNA pseudouridine synthase 9